MVDDDNLSRWPGHNKEYATRAERDAAYQVWAESERSRIASQRALFDALPGKRARKKLMRAMIARAHDLLDWGYAGAADQLLEFVPETEAERFLRDYFGEDEPQEAKTDDDQTPAD